ncbi:MAG: hypothetical protein JSV49_07505 [Thermoplasmata archaeon]|nr:MAG: hypothetical protein JSV49_07505 [Thermoplasmata archaeon]
MAARPVNLIAQRLVALALVVLIIQLLPGEFTLTDPAAANSTWTQTTEVDFKTGILSNLSVSSEGDVELIMETEYVRDDFKNTSLISHQENVVIDTDAGEAKLVKINRTYDTAEDDIGHSIWQTSDGGYIVAGYTTPYKSSRRDAWLVKTDAVGSKVWEQFYGGLEDDFGFWVQQTSDGGYIIVGRTESKGAGSSDVYLVKTDSLGNMVWDRTFGGVEYDFGYSGALTSDGGFIIAGGTQSFGAGGADVWLIKTDSGGELEWNVTIGGSKFDKAYGVQQTSDSGYIITGYTWSYGTGEADMWLIKTNSTGFEEWNNTFGGGDLDYGYSVQQIPEGGYIITGYTWSFGSGDNDVWLVKTDSFGVKDWDKTFGGNTRDYGNSIQCTSDGGFIIVAVKVAFGYSDYDIWLIKTKSNGIKEWDRIFDASDSDVGNCVQQTSDGGYVIAGYTDIQNNDDLDMWIIKTDSSGNVNIESGEFISENMISSTDIYSIDTFYCYSIIPDNTEIRIQFSQDKAAWYNSNGFVFSWNTISSGTEKLDLSPLNWNTPDFYYRIQMSSNVISIPIVTNVTLAFRHYAYYGTLTSYSYRGSVENVNWDMLSWTTIEPKDTQIKFQLRSAGTKNALLDKNFVGPDGTPDNYYKSSNLWEIWDGHDGDSWMQYRVYFISYGKRTPTLENIEFSYNCIPTTNIQSTSQSEIWFNNSAPILSWEFNDADGSQEAFQIEIDNQSDFSVVDFDTDRVISSNEYWQFPEGTDYTALPDGIWYWRVRARDTDLDWSEYSNYSVVKVDTTPPTSLVISTPSQWCSEFQPEISFSAEDATSGIDYYLVSIDGKELSLQKSPLKFPPQLDGEHVVTVRAYDKAGNFHEASSEFKIDATPPRIVHEPVTSAVEGKKIEITARVTDAQSGIENVTLYYRNTGDNNFTSINMQRTQGDTYLATIPSRDVRSNIEYHIEATDKSKPENFKYFGAEGEYMDEDEPASDIEIEVGEAEDDKNALEKLSMYNIYIIVIIITIIAIVVLLLFSRRSRASYKSASKPSPPPTPSDPIVQRRMVKVKAPTKKKKKDYFEQPPELRPYLTELLDHKTAMIKFHCSYCDQKSIVQVSKEYHSVICPNCDKETPIGPG